MKTTIIILISIAIAFLSCKKDGVTIPNNDITTQINAYPKEPLSVDEISSLQWMREEEKLAHDVYIVLYSKWNVNIFTNIAYSEQIHTSAVLTLLNKYEISDPVGSNGVGVFSDTTLQNLYVQLVAQGNISVEEAFKVGATIEDLDIFDLNNRITKVDNQDIKFVYQNLMKGSRNHIRSFYSQIISYGGTYTARFISQSELEAIINSPKEMGSW
ncbi:MAG: DUF2202 domain-containing protein [Candidatus Kapaibacterium sp.]|jgi:hypothetical protein